METNGRKSSTERPEDPKPAEKEISTVQSPIATKPTTGQLRNYGGSDNDAFNAEVKFKTVLALTLNHSDKEDAQKQINAALAGLSGIKPNDELEGMLAAQMVATYNAAMQSFEYAMRPGQSLLLRRENLNQANKLTRSYTEMMGALDRHRGKGQQHVTVEHVHINKGAQAIVGNVTPRGEGDLGRNTKQPHAKACKGEIA
jgi:hypothetical protein